MGKRLDGARNAPKSASRSGPRSRWEEHRARFEVYLEGLVFSEEPRLETLVEAMRYSMLGGGKRVRPTLCMEVAEVFGAESGLVVQVPLFVNVGERVRVDTRTNEYLTRV